MSQNCNLGNSDPKWDPQTTKQPVSPSGGSKEQRWDPHITKKPASASCITLVIFADNDRDIENAKAELEKIIDEDFTEKKFNERIISQLSDNQVRLFSWDGLFGRFTSLQCYFSHIVTWKEEISILWNC